MTERGLAFAGALGAALAVHAGVLLVWEPAPAGGAQSAGDGGDALVSLAPSSPSMAARVAEWERPPEVETEVAATQPEAPTAPNAPKAPNEPIELAPQVAAPTMTTPPAPDAALPEQADPAPLDTPRPKAKPTPPAPKPAQPKAPAKQQASQPAPAQPKQQAKGQGDRGAAGDRRTAPAATLSAGQIRSLMGSWGGDIRARIERAKQTPSGAGAGRVIVALNIARDGRLIGASVAQSSGNATLDRAALEAVRRAGRFPAAPQGLGKPSYSFSLPMAFR
ncbi:cell envelope integrity protein TolA [Thioclava nitratireducens]|uniref:cell envelope integrity protein TolA n=1 Tax=Thioclava nitratireducens TaxID=1915078 RepID=UPI00247FB398|nr:TonB family protein [Thioclava nitratireducens]WGT50802.1 TonB family protein [Thioclava nitratireducens]